MITTIMPPTVTMTRAMTRTKIDFGYLPPMTTLRIFCIGIAVAAMSCAGAAPSEIGLASRYSDFSQTASGQNHSAKDMVAAHRTLPFGTRVKVQSLATGKSVTVTIVDRGPFVKTRVIDLSSGAANILGLVDLERVRLTVVPYR